MKNYTTDKRVVLPLDAGGTNMVFCDIRGGEFISKSVTLPSDPDNLDLCLKTMVKGFKASVYANMPNRFKTCFEYFNNLYL